MGADAGLPDHRASPPKAGLDPNAPKSFEFAVDPQGYPRLPPDRGSSMSIAGGRARWRSAGESIDRFCSMPEKPTPGSQSPMPPASLENTISRSFWRDNAMDPDRAPCSGPSIFAALRAPLGSKLEAKKIPLDMVVRDHLERTPTENSLRAPGLSSRASQEQGEQQCLGQSKADLQSVRNHRLMILR